VCLGVVEEPPPLLVGPEKVRVERLPWYTRAVGSLDRVHAERLVSVQFSTERSADRLDAYRAEALVEQAAEQILDVRRRQVRYPLLGDRVSGSWPRSAPRSRSGRRSAMRLVDGTTGTAEEVIAGRWSDESTASLWATATG
jgi:hypothetical protein